MANIEDPESGPDVNPVDTEFNADVEFERIKENYRTTVIAAELPTNYPESQVAFHELQNELQEFLSQYIPKIASLQVIVSSNFVNGSVYENRVVSRASRLLKASMLIQNSDQENVVSPELNLDEEQAKVQLDPDAIPSRHSSVNQRKAPVNAHMQALQSFLASHMENILSLQGSLSTPAAEFYAKQSTVSHNHRVPHAHVIRDGEKNHEALASRCHSVSAISTATAIFTFALLILSRLILGDDRRIAFDVGMTFAFLSLFLHFGIIMIGGRGARHISQYFTSNEKNREEIDPVYFNFYLTLCEQMQLVATLLLMIATLVFLFLIFSSLGFPFLIVFLSALAAVIVLVSSYHKVLITTENLVFMAKNIRRLGWRTLDFVKTDVKTPPATYP